MTKHEFHIALLCLALIVAGVLGYQFLNGPIDRPHFDLNDLQPNPSSATAFKESPIEISAPIFSEHYRANNHELATQNYQERGRRVQVQKSSVKEINTGSAGSGFLRGGSSAYPTAGMGSSAPVIENGQEFIRLLRNGIPGVNTLPGGSSVVPETLQDLETADKSKDKDSGMQNSPVTELSRPNVMITQVNSDNVAVVYSRDEGSYAEITQAVAERNEVFLLQSGSGNSANAEQYGYGNVIAGSELTAEKITESGFAGQLSESAVEVMQFGEENRTEFLQEQSDARIVQDGTGNDVSLVQDGSSGNLVQEGFFNVVRAEQSGSSVSLYQNGTGNTIFVSQM